MALIQTLLALPATQLLVCLARCVGRRLLSGLMTRLLIAEQSATSVSAILSRSIAERRIARRLAAVCPFCRRRFPLRTAIARNHSHRGWS
jgi:hypothetical protein